MHKLVDRIAKAMAILGGIVLTLLIVLVCLSVLGRTFSTFFHGYLMGTYFPEFAKFILATGVAPINGDFELVEAGAAFAIFAFLPLCQITSSHATVDVFTERFPPRVNQVLRMVSEVLFALVLILIAWRLMAGTLSKMRYGETTFLLQFPIWWAYGASLFGAVIAALIGTYMAAVKTAEAFTGQILIPDETGSEN